MEQYGNSHSQQALLATTDDDACRKWGFVGDLLVWALLGHAVLAGSCYFECPVFTCAPSLSVSVTLSLFCAAIQQYWLGHVQACRCLWLPREQTRIASGQKDTPQFGWHLHRTPLSSAHSPFYFLSPVLCFFFSCSTFLCFLLFFPVTSLVPCLRLPVQASRSLPLLTMSILSWLVPVFSQPMGEFGSWQYPATVTLATSQCFSAFPLSLFLSLPSQSPAPLGSADC